MRPPLNTGARLALALLWLALLAVAGWQLSKHLQLSGDLRRFMPPRLSNRRARMPRAAAAACHREAPTLNLRCATR